MTKHQLASISDWFHSSPHRVPALRAVNGVCVAGAVAAFAYGVLLRPGFHDPKLTLRLVLTCGIPFVGLSAVRHALDLPRPFEVYDLEPLLPRETPGRSFPSRHVFSIFVIGTCFCYLEPWIGYALIGLGAVLSALRVLSAVHFERDVLVGAAVGVLSGIIGFGLI